MKLGKIIAISAVLIFMVSIAYAWNHNGNGNGNGRHHGKGYHHGYQNCNGQNHGAGFTDTNNDGICDNYQDGKSCRYYLNNNDSDNSGMKRQYCSRWQKNQDTTDESESDVSDAEEGTVEN